MKRKKKYRLKQWVKDFLVIIGMSVVFMILLIVTMKSYSKTTTQCDKYYGRTCSIYEIDQYGKGIRR